jgi:signal peptidase I
MRQVEPHTVAVQDEQEKFLIGSMVKHSLTADEEQLSKRCLAAEVLRRFGELRLQVTGSSMVPSLWPGDLLLIRRAQMRQLSCGDLVLFCRGNRFFVHRALAVSPNQVLTRGDALATCDAAVTCDELLGRVTSIERDGIHRAPSALGTAARCVALAVRQSTAFCNLLLRIHGLRRRLLRASALAPRRIGQACLN